MTGFKYPAMGQSKPNVLILFLLLCLCASAEGNLSDSAAASVDNVNSAPNSTRKLGWWYNFWTKYASPKPTSPPVQSPTQNPTKTPTKSPTNAPTKPPTNSPTELVSKAPTKFPTKAPIEFPTKSPTAPPTKAPTIFPTKAPTGAPTNAPTAHPTQPPTSSPTSCADGPEENIIVEFELALKSQSDSEITPEVIDEVKNTTLKFLQDNIGGECSFSVDSLAIDDQDSKISQHSEFIKTDVWKTTVLSIKAMVSMKKSYIASLQEGFSGDGTIVSRRILNNNNAVCSNDE